MLRLHCDLCMHVSEISILILTIVRHWNENKITDAYIIASTLCVPTSLKGLGGVTYPINIQERSNAVMDPCERYRRDLAALETDIKLTQTDVACAPQLLWEINFIGALLQMHRLRWTVSDGFASHS